MIVCQRCGKENQDHYKFCLGCGAEIAASDGGEAVGMMKTMMADVGSGPPGSGLPGMGNPGIAQPAGAPGAAPMGPPPGVGSPTPGPAGGPPPGYQQQQQQHQHQPPPHAAPPYGQPPGAAPYGQPPMGPPPGVGAGPPTQVAPPRPSPGPRLCPSCQAEVPPNFKFCGVCGSIVDSGPAPAPAASHAAPAVTAKDLALRATMTLIRPDGSEGGSHTLSEGINKIGRNHGAIFETDGYLSPTHADLEISRQGNRIVDLDSLNGVFVRMTEEEEVLPGQILRIGQELLRYDLIEAPAPKADGTEVMGSPNPGYWGRITVIIGDDVDGAAYPLLGDSVTLGREHGDINFPDDGYVSGMHARLVARDDSAFLSDMESSNGTFMKVQGERSLPNNSYVLLGQQLFRITVE